MTEPLPGPAVPDVRTAAGHLPGLPDVLVGHAHATGRGWATGCTVVLPPPGTVGAVAVGGGAPGTRETDALAPGTLVSTVDAVVLSGGSAYGLATADGVMAWCEQAGRGFAVPVTVPGTADGDPPALTVVRVPIVPAAVVFDLGRGGDPRARPTAAFGRAACEACEDVRTRTDGGAGVVPEGAVGAGTGARVAGGSLPGGVGVAGRRLTGTGPGQVPGGPWSVAALVVANAAGVPVGAPPPHPTPDGAAGGTGGTGGTGGGGLLHTTLAVVVTDAALDVAEATRLARAAHAGLARAVDPSHTLVDGDVVFALATGAVAAPTEVRDRVGLEAAVAHALTDAFARAVTAGAAATGGAPGGTMAG